ncbi:aldo/keto reductase [Embleya sp. NBC_00896]|uniref:aldo/keto reductase n=1 Tax=Embleya sp. NBC_00896 TaxID=2975961 RepID=UPI002F9089EC|nr:aldo/keto reductase [Embleya sp. NBC_00896]
MDRNTIGSTKVTVTRLGLGAATLGNLFAEVSDDRAAATVQAAWDTGVRWFDTAPHYGVGLSETRLGHALRTHPRAEYTISTKVGRLLVDDETAPTSAEGFVGTPSRRRVRDYSADGVRRSLESSLTRLGLDRIDIALIHDPDAHWAQAVGEAYPALAELRDQGVIGAIGVGMNQSAMPARFVAETDLDCVMLAGRYTLLDRTGTDLLDLCAERGVSVLGAGVYNSGLLADPRPGATYDYAPADPALLDRALRLKALCEQRGVPLRAAALHFVTRHPAVAAVLVGARDPQQAHDAAAMAAYDIPPDLWARLDAV